MALQAPKASDLFGDVDSAKKAAKAMDEFQESLNKSFSNPSTTPGEAPSNPIKNLEALASNKSLSPDALAGLNTESHLSALLFRICKRILPLHLLSRHLLQPSI